MESTLFNVKSEMSSRSNNNFINDVSMFRQSNNASQSNLKKNIRTNHSLKNLKNYFNLQPNFPNNNKEIF